MDRSTSQYWIDFHLSRREILCCLINGPLLLGSFLVWHVNLRHLNELWSGSIPNGEVKVFPSRFQGFQNLWKFQIGSMPLSETFVLLLHSFSLSALKALAHSVPLRDHIALSEFGEFHRAFTLQRYVKEEPVLWSLVAIQDLKTT